jgi:hypothetical protein
VSYGHIFPFYSVGLQIFKSKVIINPSRASCIMSPFQDPFIEACGNYTPHNEVVGGYTGFTMSVRPSVRPSVDKSYVVR